MEIIYNNASLKSGVYQIVNRINNKTYYGSAKEFKARIKDHIRSLRKNTHHNTSLQNSFNKYGEDNFYAEVLEVIEGSKEFRLAAEQRYLDLHCGNKASCFNANDHASSSEGAPYTKSPEQISKQNSNNMKVFWAIKENRQIMLKIFNTSEYKQTKSDKMKEIWTRHGHREKVSESMKQYIPTPEHKANISKGKKGQGTKRIIATEIKTGIQVGFPSVSLAAEHYEISIKAISECLRGRSKTCKNQLLRFEYIT